MKDRNLLRGLFLMAIALAFGVPALRYPIGEFGRAGPGLFPLLMAGMLLAVGVAMVVRSRFTAVDPMDFSVRNIAIILTSLCGFSLMSHYVDMAAGIVFLVFCAGAAGSSKYSVMRNLKISAGLLGIAFLFHHFLGLQLPLL